MKHLTQFLIAMMLMASLFLTMGALAQDAAKADPKHYKVEFENDQVRVLRISYGPGEKSVMHEHPEGVVVFLHDLQGKFTYPDGKTEEMTAKAGQTIWTPAVKHQPENTGDQPFEVIQVEMKSKTDGTNDAALRKAIEAQTAKWAAAYNRQDAAGVAALYTEDATVLPPNHEMVQGREAIANLMTSEFQMGAHELVLKTLEVVGMGDSAYEIGKYSVKIKTEGQPVMTDAGKYMGLFKRQADGTWLLYRDTWNSSMPMPGQ